MRTGFHRSFTVMAPRVALIIFTVTRSELVSAAEDGRGRAIAALRAGDVTPTFHDLRRLVLRWRGEQLVDPRVRELGFDLIGEGWLVDGPSLVATNAVSGDESTILYAVEKVTEADDLHSVECDLLRVSKELDFREVLLWVTEKSPCSFCRESAVRDLVEIGRAPKALLRECLLDCVPEPRKLAGQALS